MNWDQVEGKWKQLKGSVKQQWGKLTDDDLDYISGSRDRLTGKVQERYGMAKDEADRTCDAWLKTCRDEEFSDTRRSTIAGL
ncbi:MAG TPA: CsbD family protein [Bryobacteraceae bacterium]|nr:CsbD family protein [Bryobacteraceae bacterium]